MIHLVTLNPALDLELDLKEPARGKIGEVRHSDVEAGGKALNIARFLRKQRTQFQIWLGTGGGTHPTHVIYRSLLAREGLEPKYLSSKAPIRLNVIVKKDHKEHKYNHPGFELDLTHFGQLDRAVKKNDLLVLTGRLPGGMNPALYAAWVDSYNRKGVRTVMDTSGKPLHEALAAKPWFFKVNLHEFSEGLNQKFSNLAQVQDRLPMLLRLGLLHGAVTNGPEGAVCWNGPSACRVRSVQKVKGRMVVGAGDGFLSGYLKGLQENMPFLDCVRQACATGAAVANTGIMKFEAGLVTKLVKRVKVKMC